MKTLLERMALIEGAVQKLEDKFPPIEELCNQLATIIGGVHGNKFSKDD
jgi:hypothetical protein